MEITITDLAINKIKEISTEYGLEPTVRIHVEGVACKGASYGILFDSPKQYDVLTEVQGIEILTDTQFITKYSDGLQVDYIIGEDNKEGFVIKSIKPPVKIREIVDGEYVPEKLEEVDLSDEGCSGSCGGCSCPGRH